MRTTLVVILLSLFAVFQPAALAQSERIAASIDSRRTIVLRGSVYPKAQPQYDRGRVEASMPLEYITLVTKPSPEQQAGLQRLLEEQQNPASPRFHQWLTPEQYANRFGLSQSDVEKLSVWLRSQGFTIVQAARGRDWIAFSGSAALVENAFQTEIHYYDVDGETHFANATAPSIPASLAGVVAGFRGLNDFRWKPMSLRVPAPAGAILPDLLRPFYTIGGQHFLAPDDLATIYGLDSLYNSGIDGTGMKLVVVGQTDITVTDIDQFRAGFHLSKNDPVVTNLAGHKLSKSDLDEANLDLEWSGAVARNATILYVNSSNTFDSAVYAIDQDLAPVISISYGGCESLNAGFIPSNEPTMQKASVEGITFLASSGDSGAAGCDSDAQAAATHGLAVNYPASSPEVTGVGGTEFNEGSGNYWGATNGPNFGSALSYIPETAWNDSVQRGNLSASGGGASSCGQSSGNTCTGGFPKPSWQSGVGVPNDGVRDVPDVSLTASPDHDGYMFCTTDNATNPATHTCANGVSNSSSIVGGTSASTPVFAGIVTLLNQSLGNVPPAGLGNINPTLYQFAQNTANGAFHDVKTGNNKVPCTKGSTGCPNGGSIGYNAGTGYDRVTGLGSVDASALVSTWTAGTVSKSTTTTGLSLTASPVIAGTAVAFTASVIHASGSAVPSGTVTFNNGGTRLGSGTLNNSGKATFQTSALAGGTYSVTAAYSGDNNYAGSISSAGTLTIQDFAKPTASPTTVNVSAPGQSGKTTISITPIAGFSQAVSFSCGPLPAEAACSFNPTSVTPSGKAVTTTLTITTTAASASLRQDPVGRSAAPFYAPLFPGLLGLVMAAGAGGKPKRRGMRLLLLTVILCALTLCLPGCGGGSGGGNTGNPGTPAGSSTVTVTATASSVLSHPVQITLSVQ
ncbi:MAG: protease pro-enzyme activation domain-containing protein [Terriglobales bacterium]